MAAVLGVHLRETEHLAVGKGTSEFIGKFPEILFFFLAERKPFSAVVNRDVVNMYDGIGLAVNVEYLRVQTIIKAEKHPVELRFVVACEIELFYACYSLEAHVLGNLYGICAPRSNHFFTGTDETALYGSGHERCGAPEQP